MASGKVPCRSRRDARLEPQGRPPRRCADGELLFRRSLSSASTIAPTPPAPRCLRIHRGLPLGHAAGIPRLAADLERMAARPRPLFRCTIRCAAASAPDPAAREKRNKGAGSGPVQGVTALESVVRRFRCARRRRCDAEVCLRGDQRLRGRFRRADLQPSDFAHHATYFRAAAPQGSVGRGHVFLK